LHHENIRNPVFGYFNPCDALSHPMGISWLSDRELKLDVQGVVDFVSSLLKNSK
jgi:hypothetical protein